MYRRDWVTGARDPLPWNGSDWTLQISRHRQRACENAQNLPLLLAVDCQLLATGSYDDTSEV